jgi:hypothetical protein
MERRCLNPLVPRNPRQEAEDRLGGRYAARVLEPSPPAVSVGPYFADDPVERGEPDGREVVAPGSTGDVTWAALAAADPALADWCATRWLAACPRLSAPPDALASTREALHAVAEHVISPARAHAASGKIGLRWVRGGFGTPFFGADVQLRIEGAELVRDDADGERRVALTSLGAAAELAGVELAPNADRALDIDRAASAWLGDLYGFATSVLEQLRAEAGDDAEPSRVQLWPEHFDISVELGAESRAARAGFGVSPGDDAHDGPYLYISCWSPPPPDRVLWNASAFPGAELALADLVDDADQVGAALEFLRVRRRALH